MVSIKDIAKEVGVTPATVSMALNGKGSISLRTVEQIKEVAQRMHYVPHKAAKALKTHKSYTIGMIVGSIRNPYFQPVIAAVGEVATEHGYALVLSDARADKDMAYNALQNLQSMGVDGIVISLGFYVDQRFSDKVLELIASGIKVVSFTLSVKGSGWPLVEQVEDACIEEIVQAISNSNHHRVTLISSRIGTWLDEQRGEKMREALIRNGIDPIILHSGITIHEAEETAYAFLSEHKETEMIMAINDEVAMGVMFAARKLGIRIPQELSLAGFDGSSFTRLTTPTITTVLVPLREIGTKGTELLIHNIINNTNSQEQIFIPCSLQEGESFRMTIEGDKKRCMC